MKKQTAGLGVLCLILIVNLCVGLHIRAQEAKRENSKDVFQNIDSLMEIIQIVRQFYVNEDMVQPDKLFKGAIQGVMGTLDPFSNYLEQEQTEMLKEETEGAFGGIGIQTDFKKKYLVVIAPIDGTPAHEAGLKTGDLILKVDGENLEELGLEKTLKKLRGKPGTEVTITYTRDSFNEPKELTLKRAMIPIFSVTNPKVIKGIAYVRITQFMEKTAEELKKILQKDFSGPEVKGLVIDLRSNPGGLLASAVDICSFFLPENTFVVSVESRRSTQVHKAKGGYKFKDVPVVILVNRGSASAAEITAGCLKTHGRATLIGTKTYGKGSVQNIIPLSNGNELKLTIAHYFVQPKGTKNRRTIHKHGIEPDLKVGYSEKEQDDMEQDIQTLEEQLKDPALSETQRVRLSQEFIRKQESQDKVLKAAIRFLNEHHGKLPPKQAPAKAAEQQSAPQKDNTRK